MNPDRLFIPNPATTFEKFRIRVHRGGHGSATRSHFGQFYFLLSTYRYRAYYIFLLHTGTVSCRHRETPAVPVIVTGNVPVPVLYLSISNFINLCSTGTYISFSFVQEEASVYVYLVWLLGDYAFATVGLKCVNNELFV